MSAAWQGYASARVQARFSRRPAAHDFRQLDSSRSVAHLREALRQGPLAAFVVGLGPAPSSDDFEARLRAAWRDACTEVARWHGPEWARAFRLFDYQADLPALELLRAGGPVPAWLQADSRLEVIARAPAAGRLAVVQATYGPELSAGFDTHAPLARLWLETWRASWPVVTRPVAAILVEVTCLFVEPRGVDERRLEARTERLERLLRRGRGTPAAAFAHLVLVGSALERIRGSHAALLASGTAPS